MNVAIDARALQAGFREHAGRGIGRYAAEVVAALGRRDDVALELWIDPGLAEPSVTPPGAVVRRFPPLRGPLAARLATQTTVAWSATRSRADVFHFLSHGDAPAFVPARAVVTVHDLILEVMGGRYRNAGSLPYRLARAVEASALRTARTLIAVSAVTCDDAVRLHGVDPARVHVVHHGLHARFREPSEAEVNAVRSRFALPGLFVLYVGGIDERKNVGLLLEAFAHARTRGVGADVVLAIAGRIEDAPEYPALRARVGALGLEDAFRPLGFVGDDELPALYGAAEVFAFPSLYEGFGFPPLEAMACGTAVVSTAAGSLGEVLGDAARLAPADDPRAFGDALAAVLADPGQREDLRARGLAQAARFTWERAAEGTVQAYRAARAKGARG